MRSAATLAGEAVSATTTVASTPSSVAAQARPRPALPAEAVITGPAPARLSAASAPRTLNEPVGWNVSSFRWTFPPSAGAGISGVGASRSRDHGPGSVEVGTCGGCDVANGHRTTLPDMTARRLLLVLLVPLLASLLGAAPAAASAAAAVYTRDPLSHKLRIKPGRLLFSDSRFTELRWRRWGTDVARARGVHRILTCSPSCGEGGAETTATTVSSRGSGRRTAACFTPA